MSDQTPTPKRNGRSSTGMIEKALAFVSASSERSDEQETARLELVLAPYTRIIWILAGLNLVQFALLIGVLVAMAGGSLQFSVSADGANVGVSAEDHPSPSP